MAAISLKQAEREALWPADLLRKAYEYDPRALPKSWPIMAPEIINILGPYVTRTPPKPLTPIEAADLRWKCESAWEGFQTKECMDFRMVERQELSRFGRNIRGVCRDLGKVIGTGQSITQTSRPKWEQLLIEHSKRNPQLVLRRYLKHFDRWTALPIPPAPPGLLTEDTTTSLLPTDKQMEELEIIMGSTALEPDVEDIDQAMERLHEAALKAERLANKKHAKRYTGVVPSTRSHFDPPMPSSTSCRDHGQLLQLLLDRCTQYAWQGGAGLDLPISEIQNEAKNFVDRNFAKRPVDKLLMLANVAHTPLTIEYLKDAGILDKQVTTEKGAVYFKCVRVSNATIRQLSSATSASTRTFATRVIQHLDSHNEPTEASAKHVVMHIGRFTNGIANRKQLEAVEQAHIQSHEAGSHRPWAEVVKATRDEVQYWLLEDASQHIGQQWARRVFFGEIFWHAILLHPVHTNAAFPGARMPPAPTSPAELQLDSLQELNEDDTISLGKDFGFWRIAKDSGAVLDRVTWRSLRIMAYQPIAQTPKDFIRSFRPTAGRKAGEHSRRACIALGLDVPFDMPFITRKDGKTIRVFTLFFIAASHGETVIVRPASTQSTKYTRGPLSHFLSFDTKPETPRLQEIAERHEDFMTMRVAVGHIPATHGSTKGYGLYLADSQPREWLWRESRPLELVMQKEALQLLLEPTQQQQPIRLCDLDIVASLKTGDVYHPTIASRKYKKQQGRAAPQAAEPSTRPPTRKMIARWETLCAQLEEIDLDIMTKAIDISSTSAGGMDSANLAIVERARVRSEQRTWLRRHQGTHDLSKLPGAGEFGY